MNREQRHIARRNAASKLHDAAEILENAMQSAGMARGEKERFLDWAVGTLWSQFKEERMNQRIVIENEVRQRGIRFPNGTVKKEYKVSFDLPVDKISDITLDGAEELGLTLKVESDGRCTLSGHPLKSGDYTLTLRYATVEGEPCSQLAIPVAFNPNPRDLWKNIPTDENIPYYKPDSATEYVKVGAGAEGKPRKDMIAASQRGRSHAQEGKARDDHFSLYHCDDSDWYIMAVADGAGSARYSRKGSEVACNTVTEHCKAMLLDNKEFENTLRDYVEDRDNQEKRAALTRNIHDILLKGAKKAHDKINEIAAAQEGLQPKDFATTLMFAICKKFEFGWFIASFWVGDGAMCLYDETTKTAKLLGVPDEGEFSGQTRFLTMPAIFRTSDVYNRLRMTIVPDFTALFLMSDGVSDPMFETDKNLNSYAKWEEFYHNLRAGFPADEIGGVDLTDDNEAAKDQLLGWLDFWSPGNHDDRTIVILY